MTWFRITKNPVIGVALVVLLLTSAWPPVEATHINPDTGAPPLPEEPPRTGRELVDQPVEEAYRELTDVYRDLDEAVSEAREEPQVPAVYFHDALDMEGSDRIGGWGAWSVAASGEPVLGKGWHQSTDPVMDRQVWSFGDSQEYGIHNSERLFHYLVSPRISLESLPVNGTDRDARGPLAVDMPFGFSAGVDPIPLTTAETIMLTVVHQFHFGCRMAVHSHLREENLLHGGSHMLCDGSPGEVTGLPTATQHYQQGVGVDGGRIELFFDNPPTLEDLRVGGLPLLPPSWASVPVDAFDGDRAYSGEMPGFTQSTYDLTRFAGRDVWIAFVAATDPQGNPGQYFAREDRFDPSLSFYGWQIDRVLLEGPAWPHNVVVDEILVPWIPSDGGEADFVAPPGKDQDPLAFVVLNRGQHTATVRPVLHLETLDGDSFPPCLADEVVLRPGATTAASFPCSQEILTEGQRYKARFEARLLDGIDFFPDNNQREVVIEVTRNPQVSIHQPLSVTPRTGDVDTIRTAAITIANTGNGRETFTLELGVEYSDPANQGERVDVTESAVLGQKNFTKVVEPRQRATFTWPLLLEAPGSYSIRMNGTLHETLQGMDIFFSSEAESGTLVSSGVLYRSDFTQEDGWTMVQGGDSPPDTACVLGQGLEECVVWELPNSGWNIPCFPIAPHTCPNGVGTMERISRCMTLLARVETEQLDASPETPITSLHIEVTQWLDLPCLTSDRLIPPSSPTNHACRDIIGGNNPFTFVPRPMTTEIWYGDRFNTMLQEFRFFIDEHVVHDHSSADHEIHHYPNSHPGNFLHGYGGNWQTETHTVPIRDVMDRFQNSVLLGFSVDDWSPGVDVESVPLEVLDQLDLRFIGRGSTGQGNPTNCSPIEDDFSNWMCPAWRIAQARVVGVVEATGDEIELLGWTGNQEETLGSWGGHPEAPLIVHDVDPQPISTHWRLRGTDTLDVSGGPGDFSHRFQPGVWQNVPGWGEAAGVMTNSYGPGSNPRTGPSDQWRYVDSQMSDLVSPPITIASDAAEATLAFDHRFNFLKEENDWISDGGSLFVRFLDGHEGGPLTPFMLVPIKYDFEMEDGPDALHEHQIHRFFGNDCEYYDRGDQCDPREPSRTPVSHAIPLDRFPILDYRRLEFPLMTNPGQPDPDLDALRVVDLRNGEVLWQQEEEDGPMCTGGCTVQFAFRAQTGRHTESDYANNMPVGWFIDRFEIRGESALAHDLAVVDLRLEAEYDWESLGLGPGTTASLEIEIENRGLFQQPPMEGTSVVVDVILQHVQPTGTTQQVLASVTPTDLVLPGIIAQPDPEKRTGTIQIDDIQIPDQEGSYKLMVMTRLQGEIIEGLPLVDEAPHDNCIGLALELDGQRPVLNACDFSGIPTLPVRAIPRLEVELDVHPRVGRAGEDFPRQIEIRVNNTGNTVPQGEIRLFRSIEHADGHDLPPRSWTLDQVPPIGETRPFQDLVQGGILQEDLWVALTESGQYAIGAQLAGPGFEDEVVLIVESFGTFYADTFRTDPDRHPRDPTRNVVNPEDPDGPWGLVAGTGVLGDSRGWHFGDPERQTYPNKMDSNLLLPPLDLSIASHASLSLTHNYDFEEGYDGGILEASLDEGENWQTLEPHRGYPGHVYEGNPLNKDRDPRQQVKAWTGSSEGWQVDEFNLGQIDDFVTQALLMEFSQEGYSNAPESILERTVPGSTPGEPERASFSTTWKDIQTSNCSEDPEIDQYLESCWYRENLNQGHPPLNPAGDPGHPGEYWWTGTMGSYQGESGGTFAHLPFRIELPAVGENVSSRLTFWAWSDHANAWGHQRMVELYVGESKITLDHPTLQEGVTSTNPRSDGWREFIYHMDAHVSQEEASILDIEFRFRYEGDPVSTQPGSHQTRSDHGRGGVVDNVRFDVVHAPTGNSVEAPVLIYPDDDWWGEPYGASPGISEAWGRDRGWRPVEGVPFKAPAWRVIQSLDELEREQDVWLFGDSWPINAVPPGAGVYSLPQGDDLPDVYHDYPNDAHERLVGPIIDLTGVGGQEAFVTFWESYNKPENDRRTTGTNRYDARLDSDLRRTQIQPYIPTLGGDEPGPWITMNEDRRRTTHGGSCGDNQSPMGDRWCLRVIDISEFIGQRIRIGFEKLTDRTNQEASMFGTPPYFCATEAIEERLGCYWMIHGLQVNGETIAGQQLLLRLRAATDGSVNDGGWTIDNLQVVGSDYDQNLAVIPDDPRREHRLAHGSVLSLTGETRNLGPQSANAVLVATASLESAPPGSEPQPLELDLCPNGEEETCNMAEVNPTGAGTRRARIPFNLSIGVPGGGADNTVYMVSLELMERRSDGTFVPWIDDNLGDHRRTFMITAVNDENLRPPVVEIDPPTASLGEPIRFEATLANEGTIVASADLRFVLTDTATGGSQFEMASPILGTGNILPGTKGSVEWKWEPPEGISGFHRVDVNVTRNAFSSQDPVGLVLVGEKPIYFQEDFSAQSLQESGWASNPGCIESDCWRLRDDLAFVGPHSVHLGPLGQALRDGATYRSQQDTRLTSPRIDLTALGLLDLWELRDNSFNPDLTFRYQANIGSGDGVTVEVRRPDLGENPRWMDSEDYTGTVFSQQAFGPDLRLDTWRPASIPLGPTHDAGAPNAPLWGDGAIVGHDAEMIFRFRSTSGNGQGFTIDAVTLSSYRSSIYPEEMDVTLFTGADKTYHFLVQNTGPATDTFAVRIDEEMTTLNVFSAEILEPEVTLGPGEEALIPVRVRSPAFTLDRAASGFLMIEVASLGNPNAVSTASMALRFEPTPLPDLAVSLTRPSGTGTTIAQEEATSFHATIRNIASANTGRESRPTQLEIGLCPHQSGDFREDYEKCRENDTFQRLALREIPAIEPGEQHTQSLSWTVPTDLAGRFHVIAHADPQRLLRELDRTNNLDALPLEVIVLDRPHLRVAPGSLQVLRGQEPVHHAFEGDLLRITGEIENIGTADAENAMARLVNQFPLLERRIDRLVPGQSVSFNTQWRAEAGNWVVLLEVLPELGSRQVAGPDQSARWDLAVERGSLQLTLDPGTFLLEPGGTQTAYMRVVNTFTGPRTITTSHELPEGVQILDLPGRLQLAAGGVEEFPVQIAASPFAKDGPRTIQIGLHLDPDQGPVTQTEARVTVSRSEAVTIHLQAVSTPPGTARLPVNVTNHAAEPALVRLQAQGPFDWDLSPPPAFQLEPGATRSITLLVTIPPTTAPGDHKIDLHAQGEHLATAIVRVEARPAWNVNIEHVTRQENEQTAWVRVENTGNAPGMPLILTSGDEPEADIEPPLGIQQPGDVVVYRVTLRGNATITLPGQDAPSELPEPGRDDQVILTRWEILPRGELRAGDTVRLRVELLNPGQEPIPDYEAVLFVNGYPAADARIPLAADGIAEAELAWHARAGEHAISLTHGDHSEEALINEALQVGDTTVESVPLTGVLWLLAAALALITLARRKDR